VPLGVTRGGVRAVSGRSRPAGLCGAVSGRCSGRILADGAVALSTTAVT
jgi:hypothetical protein